MLEEGVREITSIPAKRLGLKDRGMLRPGYRADTCVFDKANIASNATARHPRRYASRIAHVLVNGKLSMHNGQRTPANPGEALREFSA